jgi:hypothetical protein
MASSSTHPSSASSVSCFAFVRADRSMRMTGTMRRRDRLATLPPRSPLPPFPAPQRSAAAPRRGAAGAMPQLTIFKTHSHRLRYFPAFQPWGLLHGACALMRFLGARACVWLARVACGVRRAACGRARGAWRVRRARRADGARRCARHAWHRSALPSFRRRRRRYRRAAPRGAQRARPPPPHPHPTRAPTRRCAHTRARTHTHARTHFSQTDFFTLRFRSCAFAGIVVTLSGVCFWVGVWDVLDYAVLPRGWQWRVRPSCGHTRTRHAHAHTQCKP